MRELDSRNAKCCEILNSQKPESRIMQDNTICAALRIEAGIFSGELPSSPIVPQMEAGRAFYSSDKIVDSGEACMKLRDQVSRDGRARDLPSHKFFL